MSSRLARIEAWAKFALKNGGPEDKFDDVLALVNVAKAAEQLRRPEGRVYCKGGDETCEDCVGSCGIEEWIEFREALAVLDKAGGK